LLSYTFTKLGTLPLSIREEVKRVYQPSYWIFSLLLYNLQSFLLAKLSPKTSFWYLSGVYIEHIMWWLRVDLPIEARSALWTRSHWKNIIFLLTHISFENWLWKDSDAPWTLNMDDIVDTHLQREFRKFATYQKFGARFYGIW
jgi:hypothetical protein